MNTQIQKSEQEFDKDAINKKNDNIRIQEDLIYEQITRFIIKSNSKKLISRENSLLFKTGTKLTFTITDISEVLFNSSFLSFMVKNFILSKQGGLIFLMNSIPSIYGSYIYGLNYINYPNKLGKKKSKFYLNE